MTFLSLEQIQRKAPSVFAAMPWGETSDKYRFIPTSDIVSEMLNKGYACTSAAQAKTRIPGKGEFTKHILRFRHADHEQAGDVVPELVLINSHDRTSAYRFMLGLFRTVCLNGLVVCDSMFQEVSVRHMGQENLMSEVINASYEVINQAPKAIEHVKEMSSVILSPQEQEIFAKSAIEMRGTALSIEPSQVLRARREADKVDDAGNRDLWRTMNACQENLIRGGIYGKSDATKRWRRLKGIKSVSEDNKLNRAIWTLSEEMAKLKQAA